MTDKPLWQWSACEIAEATHRGAVSAADAVGAAVERMRAVNGHLNAVVDDLGDDALERAAALDAAFAESGPVGPLHGVAVTIKENVDQKGRATPNGVTAFKDVIAPDDAPVVRNLTRAGAVVIGRTNTPEFSFRATTVNELHGRTMNPWNDAATGAVTVKPGLGRVPAYNPSATEERGLMAQLMSVQGLIAREARDLRLGLQSLVQYDAHDPWQVPMPFEGPRIEAPIKVAFTKETFEFDLHPAVDAALETACEALTDAGYEVHEVEPPMLREAALDGYSTLLGETIALLGGDIRDHGSETIRRIFDDYGQAFGPYKDHDLLLGMARRARYARAWTLFMEDYPLVLTPFLPHPTYGWNRDEEGVEGVIEVLGAGLYSFAMNLMGLPAGIVTANANDGLPVGVQIAGRRFREDLICDALSAVEARVGIMAEVLFAREGA
jgi:amidase